MSLLCVSQFNLPVSVFVVTVCRFKWIWPSFQWQFHSFFCFQDTLKKRDLHCIGLCNVSILLKNPFLPGRRCGWECGREIPGSCSTVLKVIYRTQDLCLNLHCYQVSFVEWSGDSWDSSDGQYLFKNKKSILNYEGWMCPVIAVQHCSFIIKQNHSCAGGCVSQRQLWVAVLWSLQRRWRLASLMRKSITWAT